MQKENRHWMGIVSGAVLMFGCVQLLRDREPAAHAAPQGVDNQGKYVLAVGGSEANRNDLVWVLHEHPTHPSFRAERGDDATAMKPNQITLCLYKAERQGEKMRFVAARDIAYDIELQNMNQEDPDATKVYQSYKARLQAAAKK